MGDEAEERRHVRALGLDPQTERAIRAAQLTVRELREWPDRRLLLVQDIGVTRLHDIRRALADADAAGVDLPSPGGVA